MRKLAIAAALVLGPALVAYAVGLGVYAVASSRPRVPTQPRSAGEAHRALVRLDLAGDYPFAHRFALTPHGRMHYVDEGRGGVQLCLHGNGSWSLECAKLVLARSGDARVIAPDLIGFGLSEKPRSPAPDPIAAHAEDLAALVGALDVRDVQVIASRSSAKIAIRLARVAPERVRSTVIEEETAAGGSALASLATLPLVGELLAQGFGALSPGFARGPFGRLQGDWDERASSLALARAR